MEVPKGTPIPYAGSPVTVLLDGTLSKDEDGRIVDYRWMAGDIPSSVRYAGNGMVDGGGAGPFTGDPAAGPMAQVALPEGEFKYSLWVLDNDGYASRPATVTATVETPSNYMPDATCMADYPNPNTSCAECVCSPMSSMGCLELYNNCYKNADPTFAMLCGAIITCAIGGNCVGTACYAAAPLCMTQIDAAATYMGGTLSNCSMGEMTSNPCRAANLLGACTNFDAMMVDGPCRGVCRPQ
jgi:hypothetical protein